MKSGISLLALAALAWTGAAVAKPVKQWTDATTGHEIVQITDAPGGAAADVSAGVTGCGTPVKLPQAGLKTFLVLHFFRKDP